MVTVTILTPEAPASATSPLTEAAEHLTVVAEQQDHAMTVQRELAGRLPVPASSLTICRYGTDFHGRYGVQIAMPLECTDLVEVQRRLGGSLMVEVRESAQGYPYTRHELTGTHAGVPFEVWTNVYSTRLVVAA